MCLVQNGHFRRVGTGFTNENVWLLRLISRYVFLWSFEASEGATHYGFRQISLEWHYFIITYLKLPSLRLRLSRGLMGLEDTVLKLAQNRLHRLSFAMRIKLVFSVWVDFVTTNRVDTDLFDSRVNHSRWVTVFLPSKRRTWHYISLNQNGWLTVRIREGSFLRVSPKSRFRCLIWGCFLKTEVYVSYLSWVLLFLFFCGHWRAISVSKVSEIDTWPWSPVVR